MPDKDGRFRGISVPRLPWLEEPSPVGPRWEYQCCKGGSPADGCIHCPKGIYPVIVEESA